MRWLGLTAFLLMCSTLHLGAAAPDRSLKPVPRIENAAVKVTRGVVTVRSQRPALRPKTILARAKRRSPAQTAVERVSSRIPKGAQGSVCGDASIKGVVIAPIQGRISGCGVMNPVRISSVDGVALEQQPRIDCNTARALKSWVRNGVKPAFGKSGGGVKSLRVVAHYACRTRNSQRGAKISEHGKGRAVDIAAFNLANGRSVTVLKDWNGGSYSAILQRIHRAACGPFGTVLGPRADRFHQDHFHLDTARYRSGTYCR